MIYETEKEFWDAIAQSQSLDEKLDILFNDDYEEAAE